MDCFQNSCSIIGIYQPYWFIKAHLEKHAPKNVLWIGSDSLGGRGYDYFRQDHQMFLQSFYKISLVVFFFDYTDDLYCSLDIIFALEAGSSWRTIKMSMPDNSDLRQIIMAFCMVRNPIFSQNLIIALF